MRALVLIIILWLALFALAIVVAPSWAHPINCFQRDIAMKLWSDKLGMTLQFGGKLSDDLRAGVLFNASTGKWGVVMDDPSDKRNICLVFEGMHGKAKFGEPT